MHPVFYSKIDVNGVVGFGHMLEEVLETVHNSCCDQIAFKLRLKNVGLYTVWHTQTNANNP